MITWVCPSWGKQTCIPMVKIIGTYYRRFGWIGTHSVIDKSVVNVDARVFVPREDIFRIL